MKAQISLDLMLAITVALIVIGTIGIVSNEATEQQKIAGIREQLDSIGTELSSVISTSMIFNDASQATVEFDVPEILVLGKMKPQPCKIQIAGKKIILSYELFNLETGIPETISVSKEFAEPVGMALPIPSIKCGEKFIITRGP